MKKIVSLLKDGVMGLLGAILLVVAVGSFLIFDVFMGKDPE